MDLHLITQIRCITYVNLVVVVFRICIRLSDPADLKPNWNPKADVPQTVPKLPPEYIHRHRLMKQAVNSLLGSTGAESDDANENIVSCQPTSVFTRNG